MIARIEKTQQGSLYIPLTAEMVEELRLAEGASVELSPAVGAGEHVIRYASREEVMKAYEDSKEQFSEAYAALAK